MQPRFSSFPPASFDPVRWVNRTAQRGTIYPTVLSVKPEHHPQEVLHSLLGRPGRGWVVAHMRIKLDAGLLVREGLPGRDIDEHAGGVFPDAAMAHRLVVLRYDGRRAQQRVVEGVRGIGIFG